MVLYERRNLAVNVWERKCIVGRVIRVVVFAVKGCAYAHVSAVVILEEFLSW